MSPTPILTTDDLRRMVDEIWRLAPAVDDADRIERVRQFERMKAVAAAEQMNEAVEFASSQRIIQAARGVPAARQGRGIASQLALARRVSPWAAQRWLGWGRVLTAELPATFAELRAGRTSEWRAVLVARETAFLSRADRGVVDCELAPRLHSLGDRTVDGEARKIAYRLDPAAAARRASNAATDRCVTIRPAPDLMCRLSTLVPLEQGVAAYAALTKHADSVIAVGDQRGNGDGTLRGRGQIMADTLIERVTGQSTADDVAVEINLVVSDAALFNSDTTAHEDSACADEPAVVLGYGPIPAGVARDIALGRPGHRGARWLRRVFTCDDGSRLVAMESTRREFTQAQRMFLQLRDQTCRTPWCDAPIRHADHVMPHNEGGPTHVDNGQGLCETCNYAKQAPGWSAKRAADGQVFTRTPTGHVYSSSSPDPPRPGQPIAPVEHELRWLHAPAVA